MANDTSKIDANRKHSLMGVTDGADKFLKNLLVDPTTGRLKVSAILTAALEDLSDVTITSIADNQILTYDTASSKWINEDPSAGSGDVVGPATNTDLYLPQWDGADSKTLKNGVAIPAGGLAGLTAQGLNDSKVSFDSTSSTRLANTSGTNTGDNTVATALTGTPSIVVNKITTTGNIELGHASDTTLARSAAGVLAVEGVVIPSISSTSTLTNKRITKRVVTTTDDATAVINTDITDVYDLSAVANATTFTLTGTPTDGQTLMVRFKDAGAAKGLTWTGFTAIGVTLPTTTVISKQHYVGCVYNGTTGTPRWEAIAVGVQA